MSASPKQIKLIEKLQDLGAPIPENDRGNPDSSMFDSVENADAYIKLNLSFMNKNPEQFQASPKQISLIKSLLNAGGEHYSEDDVFKTVSTANEYIQDNLHIMNKRSFSYESEGHHTLCRADEWGGIPNH